MRGRPASLAVACLAAASLAVAGEAPGRGEFGRAEFVARGELPAYRSLTPTEQDGVHLGQQVFNTQFVAAGTPGAGRRAGLGPLFNLPACDACHNDGARGAGPTGDGEAPSSLVLQLASPGRPGASLHGDPVYGRTLNTAAADGFVREGRVFVRYDTERGNFADGKPWEIRVPHYEVRELGYGDLAPDTVLMPRVPPAIFGVGLLEAVVARTGSGRFGWQGGSSSVRDQTTKAAAREMGITSSDVAQDDCTERQQECRRASSSSSEFDAELLRSLVAFQQRLAVPAIPRDEALERRGADLFHTLRCADCHSPSMPIDGRSVGAPAAGAIHP